MEAEDHALKVGRAFSSLLSAYGGYPNEPPYLKRVACTDFNANLTSEHHYCYRSTPQMLAQFDSLVGYQFERFLQSISEVDSKTKHQLQSAIHWYQISISSDEPTVSYVAAWTGGLSAKSSRACPPLRQTPEGSRAHYGKCGLRPTLIALWGLTAELALEFTYVPPSQNIGVLVKPIT